MVRTGYGVAADSNDGWGCERRPDEMRRAHSGWMEKALVNEESPAM